MAEPIYNPQCDLNKDGFVDDADFTIFKAAYNSAPGSPNWNPACDFDGDGRVAGGDFSLFLACYGGVKWKFEVGVAKIARVRLTNPAAKQFTYLAELYIEVTRVATSGVNQVTVPAGGTVDADFAITMPQAEGNYQLYLDVWEGATLLGYYKVTEKIAVRLPPL